MVVITRTDLEVKRKELVVDYERYQDENRNTMA